MNRTTSHGLLLALLCFVMFWWRLGHLGLIDPDEPFYAQTTREMVQANDWITPQIFGQPQFEKPIFFYWQTMVAQKVFGDTEFAARFPSALFATALVFGTWIFGRRLLSPTAGFLSAVVLGTGIEFALMARLMLTDISLAFFILVSFAAFWMALEDEKNRQRWVFLQLLASAFASLTKGPIGLLFPVLGCGSYLLLMRKKAPWRGPGFWLGAAAWLVIAVPWYVIMLMKYGREYWDAFFVHENWERLVVAEHPSNDHFWYYPMILAVGSLPWMPLLVGTLMNVCRQVRLAPDSTVSAAGLKKRASWLKIVIGILRRIRIDRVHPTVLFLICWFLPNLIFLTIVKSKLPSYIFFLFVPMALLMGRTLDSWVTSGFRNRAEYIVTASIAIIQAVGLLGAPFMRPEAAKYGWLAAIVAVPMGLAGLCILLRWQKFAATATALAGVFVVIIALAWVAPDIEFKVSTRPIAAKIHEMRKPGEPLITAAFLARAVTYYGGEKPVAVMSYNEQPFFTRHPLPFVRGDKGIAEFLKDKPSLLYVGQVRDLERFVEQKSKIKDRCDVLAQVGEGADARVILRIKGAAAKETTQAK